MICEFASSNNPLIHTLVVGSLCYLALKDQQLNNLPASFPRSSCPREGVGRESIMGLLLTSVSYFSASP
jgi:hypothetical protein